MSRFLISKRYSNLSYSYSNITMRLGKFSILATGYVACYEYVGSKYSGTRISHVLPPHIPTCGTDLLTDGCSDGVQGMPSAVAAIPSYPSSFAGKLCITFRFYYCKLSKFGFRSGVGIITLFRE